MRRGFTLLEVVVCIGIIVVLVSILSPALAQARMGAKATASKGNLRQIYVGLMLYREANGSSREQGTPAEMGLPPNLSGTEVFRDVVRSVDVWRSPCCCHRQASSGFPSYAKYFTDYSDYFYDDHIWKEMMAQFDGMAPLVADFHCNPPALDIFAPDEPVTSINVRLNGRIETRRKFVPASLGTKYYDD